MLTGFATATIINLRGIQRLNEILNLTAELHAPVGQKLGSRAFWTTTGFACWAGSEKGA